MQLKKHFRDEIALWICLCLPGFVYGSLPAASEREVAARVITRWDRDCDADTVNDWDNMVDAWYDEMVDDDASPNGHGSKAWIADGLYVNDNSVDIVDSDFTDPGIVWWGNDDGGDRLDDVDVYMVGFHGVDDDGERWNGAVLVNESPGGGCVADQEEIQLGNLDLEFLHWSSCESMNEESWTPEWTSTFAGLHQIDGWHGLMWISTSFNGRYRGFADDAFDDGIAFAWVENHFDNATDWEKFWNTQDHDHCPVARGIGTSESNAESRMTNEEYDDVFSDLSAGQIGYHIVLFYDNCDPKSEDPL